MKRIMLVLTLLYFLCGIATADAYGTFSNLVKFHATIGELVRSPQSIDPSRLYMVEGMVTAVRIVNADPGNYYAETELISAEWDDQDAINTFRIILIFDKAEFEKLLVSKSNQASDVMQIGPNTRGLALIQFAKLVPASATAKNGGKVPVFIAHDFRILE